MHFHDTSTSCENVTENSVQYIITIIIIIIIIKYTLISETLNI